MHDGPLFIYFIMCSTVLEYKLSGFSCIEGSLLTQIYNLFYSMFELCTLYLDFSMFNTMMCVLNNKRLQRMSFHNMCKFYQGFI